MRHVLIFVMMLILLTGSMVNAEVTTSKFKVSFIERFRFVGWDNAINLSDGSSEVYAFTRHRTSLMAQWFPNKELEFAVKLTNEFRMYLSPKAREFEISEIIFDQLYVKWQNVGKLPLTLTLGRQNIILGEGFLVMDGHPLDGSRSIYFNAARLDYRLSPNHQLTAFFTYQPETDDILPVIHSQDTQLIEKPEQGIGLYYTGTFKKASVEAYFIRKDVDGTDERPVESGINALGARIGFPLSAALSLTSEGTYQFGSWGDYDRSAWGGYFHLDYKLGERVPLFRTLTLGGIYLSGDDPSTDKMEGWDALFSRWPKWSESYIYTLIRENGVAYWSNFNSIYLSLLMDFTERMNLTLTWHRMGAVETGAAEFPGGTGKTRGDLIIAKLDFKINKYFSGHFLWEYFNPGNFYFNGASSFNWLRFELMYKF
jgi:hypothetical protein